MPPLDFPNAPVDGEFHTDPSNGVQYVYAAAKGSWTGSITSGGGGGLTSVETTDPIVGDGTAVSPIELDIDILNPLP